MGHQRGAVAQIVQHLAPGGLETMVLNLQQASPWPTHVIALEGSERSSCDHWGRLRHGAGPLHFIDKGQGVSLTLCWQLARLLRRARIAVVHTHHLGPLLYGGVAARLAGCRLVHTEHDAWYLESRQARSLAGSALRLLRPALVADASEVADGLLRWFPWARPSVIRNGIDTTHFTPGDRQEARQRLALPPHGPLLGCAARLEPVKDHALLLRALTRLPDEVHLALAGDGSLQNALRSQASQLGLTHRVHFLGQVEQMPHFYRALDLMVLPSKSEGLPLTLLEAQSCNTPVIAFAVGGCGEAVCPETGTLLKERSDAALAHALLDALRHPKGGCPRHFVKRHGSEQAMVTAYGHSYFPDEEKRR